MRGRTSADNVSDMKTFTVRELDRTPSAVLDAADKDGEVEIRRRDGRKYRVAPAAPPKKVMKLPADYPARVKKLFPIPIPKEQFKMVDRLIAGE